MKEIWAGKFIMMCISAILLGRDEGLPCVGTVVLCQGGKELRLVERYAQRVGMVLLKEEDGGED